MSRPTRKTFQRVLACLLCCALVSGSLGLGGCSGPSLPDLSKQLKGTDQTTVMLAADGSEIARINAGQDRTDVRLSDVPKSLRDAVVATEDRRFYEHRGVDPLGMLRAAWSDITGGSVQGGSTITQQYVKNAWLSSDRTLERKVDEARLAVQLEQQLSKDQILERYLNTIYYGHSAWGVASAARTYFGKPVGKLTLAEAAMVAGVIRSPGKYSPYLDPVAAKQRRDTVLGLMLDQGMITTAERDAAVATPVKTVGLKRRAGQPTWFVDWVRGQLVDRFGASMVLRGGLKVSTTLSPQMQRGAEEAVAAVLDRKGDPSAALVAVEPGTGAVRALVGGRDPATEHFDTAVQGRRQPGSAFKPFVLAAALAQGVSLWRRYSSDSARLPLPGGGSWSVSGPGGGDVPLTTATAKSVNPVFARLILQIGPQKVVDMAHTLGVTSDVEADPAIALGGLAKGVSPLEMAGAYATLAANGRRASPYAIESVASADGTVLYKAEHKTDQGDPCSPGLARHEHPGGCDRRRDGDPRPAGQTGRRQDRHHAGLPRRMVRRLRAAVGRLGVGGLPGGRPQDGRRARRTGHGRVAARSDLEAIHDLGTGWDQGARLHAAGGP